MSNDYIRKQDVLNLPQNKTRGMYGVIVRRDISVADIKSLEPADVAPVVHGRWIDDGTEFGCQCSECGKSLDDYVAPTEYVSLNEIPNFCPSCGAKMDGEEDENG